MNFNSLSKKELVSVLSEVSRVLLDAENNVVPGKELLSNSKSELESLIGTIPFLLLNRRIFEKNQDIADFAERISIHIPFPEKRKIDEIIGRIISGISKFDQSKIEQLHAAIDAVKKNVGKGEKPSFFKDWQDAIKNMKL